jgi:hypothetical protein
VATGGWESTGIAVDRDPVQTEGLSMPASKLPVTIPATARLVMAKCEPPDGTGASVMLPLHAGVGGLAAVVGRVDHPKLVRAGKPILYVRRVGLRDRAQLLLSLQGLAALVLLLSAAAGLLATTSKTSAQLESARAELVSELAKVDQPLATVGTLPQVAAFDRGRARAELASATRAVAASVSQLVGTAGGEDAEPPLAAALQRASDGLRDVARGLTDAARGDAQIQQAGAALAVWSQRLRTEAKPGGNAGDIFEIAVAVLAIVAAVVGALVTTRALPFASPS